MTEKKKAAKKPIEQYDHKGKQRVNNPPVGLVTPETDLETGKKTYSYDPHLDPQLQWAGKAERTSFAVPIVSLHVHERIDPKTIIEATRQKNNESPQQMSLFEMKEENPPLREAIKFYKHKHNWSNRLIAGDSLLVMNSLLEKEGMAGKVQMIYIDPPYGIKYGSNFQPFVNKRDVKDRKDEDLTAEPEMIKAFRDTWELGIHSYLSYLRDRLLLTRELLTESGSVFVQISDENVHLVRNILDEVLGKENHVAMIAIKRPTMAKKIIRNHFNFILWYTKNIDKIKSYKLFLERNQDELPGFEKKSLGMENIKTGRSRVVTKNIRENLYLYIKKWHFYQLDNLVGIGITKGRIFDYVFNNKNFSSGKGWKISKTGLERIRKSNRLEARGSRLCHKNYLNDYPVVEITNLWEDTAGPNKEVIYVVQTKDIIIQRCLLMTTDPGDLVFDPTCGSGTTAFVAEQWGRRWITCDTSRVAVTLAKQRLMTAVYDYYELAYPNEGVGSGFKYKSVPHITLKSIANNEEIDRIYDSYHPGIEKVMEELNSRLGEELKEWEVPYELEPSWPANAKEPFNIFHRLKREMQQKMDESIQKNAPQETLYDQPFIDRSKTRVSGPFTVEAVPAPVVKPISGIAEEKAPYDASVSRSGETLRQSEWRDELLKTGIRGKAGQRISFSRVEPLPGTRWLQADAETKEDKTQRVVISFGSEYAPLEQRQVYLAVEEAQRLVPRPGIIVFAAFQFDPEAAKDIDETVWPGVTLLKVQMNADLLTEDLKKKRASNESFWLIGQPDIKMEAIKKGKDKGKYTAKVRGFDYYNTRTGIIESGGSEKIALWMLDTDYDGRSIYPSQVFFPLAGKKEGWSRLARNLKAEIDEELVEAYRGTVSLPFKPGKHRRIAVKIVDDRGIESLKVVEVE